MNLVNINKKPDGYDCYDLSDFYRECVDDLEKIGIEYGWYCYATESYDGTGNAIFYMGGKYYFWDCGHCSCYGPVDRFVENFNTMAGYDSLDEFKGSEDCMKNYKDLIIAASKEF